MATNPYVNKVQYGNSTVMDITDTTASEGDVANGEVFYKKSGERATGTAMVAEIPLLPAHGGTGNESGRVQVGQVSGTAVGEYATSEGLNTNASGANSHAEGSGTTASSTCAHAEGMATTASHYYAHAEGANNTASGISSHAEGQNNTASGGSSHAGGFHTIAGYNYQTAIGTYNDNKSTTLFEVGNGTSNSASNAFEVYSDGHVNAQGEYYQGGVNKSAAWDAKVSESLLKDTVGWVGKNEFDPKKFRSKAGDVAYTEENNGIKVSNSTSGQYEFASFWLKHLKANTDYTIKTDVVKTSGTSKIIVRDVTTDTAVFTSDSDITGEQSLTFNSGNYTSLALNLYSAFDTAKSGEVSYKYLMVYDASITDSTFEPYHESVEQCKFDRAEQRVLGAKNLLPIKVSSQEVNGITFTVYSDGSIKANGTSSAAVDLRINVRQSALKINDVLRNNAITASGCRGGSSSTYYLTHIYYDANNSNLGETAQYNDEVNLTIPANAVEINSAIIIRSGKTLSNVMFYPMLRLASDSDDTYAPYAMTNKELTDSKDTWTGTSTVDSSGNVVFDNLNDDYAYDLYADDVLITYSGMTKGTGTSSGIKLTYATDAPNGTVCKLRILK